MRRRRASRILGVPAASPARTVNKKYRELARAAHPDRPGGSEDLFKELSAARDALLASDSDSDSGGSAQGGDDRGRDYFHRIAVSLDEMYTGRVSFIGMKRTVIAADGCTTATVRETLRVEVPRGASGGDQIVFKGKADEEPGCVTVGRLVLCIKELPHDVFQRSGAHLLHVLETPLFEALCDFRAYDIEHLDARTLRLRVPRAQGAFEAWRIPGEGMPLPRGHVAADGEEETQEQRTERSTTFGDLFCVRRVMFPDSLSAPQRAVLKTVLPPPALILDATSASSDPVRKGAPASRARVRLRSIKRSEFVRCVSAFPNVCGNAVFYERPCRDSDTGYDVTDPNSFPQAPAAGGDSVKNQKLHAKPHRARRWSVDDDDGFDAEALEEDDPGDCDTQ